MDILGFRKKRDKERAEERAKDPNLFDGGLEVADDLDALLDSVFRISTIGIENVETAEGDFTHSAATASEEELAELGFYEPQIEEIRKGKEAGLDVKNYAMEQYNWKQMREIRLGLEQNLDVSLYENVHFNSDQMREIRIGLRDKLDVSKYASLLNSADEMRDVRIQLSSEAIEKKAKGYQKVIYDEMTGIQIIISDDYLSASMSIPEKVTKTFQPNEIEAALRRAGIEEGFVEEHFAWANDEKYRGLEVTVAEGKAPEAGKNGHYEFFFDTDTGVKPSKNPDGSINYSNYIQGAIVKKGDVIAQYFPATEGIPGQTVTGIPVWAKKGKDLPPLQLSGVISNASTNRYIATTNGNAHYSKNTNTLRVAQCMLIEGKANYYNNNIEFSGDIMVNGDVEDNAKISASGNIVVNGFVGKCTLYAGQDIVIKGGANGEQTQIKAGGSVAGSFFENVNIIAGGNVSSNYFSNCVVKSMGEVRATGMSARIIGGSIQAAYSIESMQYLSVSNSHMVISAGGGSWIKEMLDGYLQHMEQLEKQIEQLEEIKKQFLMKLSISELEHDLQYNNTNRLLEMTMKECNSLPGRIEHLKSIIEAGEGSAIVVGKGMDAGIIISIGDVKTITQDPIKYKALKKADLQQMLQEFILKNKEKLLRKEEMSAKNKQ